MSHFAEALEGQRVARNYPSFAGGNRKSYAVFFAVLQKKLLAARYWLRAW